MGDLLLEAFWLLVVGMGSAFFVLFLIGVLGRFLIRWTNSQAEKNTTSASKLLPSSISGTPQHIAVITAVVETITDGEGRVDSIIKMKS